MLKKPKKKKRANQKKNVVEENKNLIAYRTKKIKLKFKQFQFCTDSENYYFLDDVIIYKKKIKLKKRFCKLEILFF